ncbi:MAG: hypothetical protein HFH26_15435 [Clostridiaceae bacterium]|nr:hypothetical protein [Clostridiaceae bacterium]
MDEADYLVKRLESFDDYEASQFQAMASKLELSDILDFINLTFSNQQATVLTDFNNLEQAGRSHVFTIRGGCMSTEEPCVDEKDTSKKCENKVIQCGKKRRSCNK